MVLRDSDNPRDTLRVPRGDTWHDWVHEVFWPGLIWLAYLLMAAGIISGCSPIGDGVPGVRGPLVLSPDPELLQDTQDAVNAWNAATGLGVSIADGGVTVSLTDGIDACGMTYRYAGGEPVGIVIQRDAGQRCRTYAGTIRHELGHALTNNGNHTPDGLMALKANAHYAIDNAALELVCASSDCEFLNPAE